MIDIKHILLILVICLAAGCSSIEKPNYHAENSLPIEEADGIAIDEEPIIETNYFTARVKTVIDGDTIILDGRTITLDGITTFDTSNLLDLEEITVRLLAIDTPEITNGKNELYGKEAKEVVEYMVLGEHVVIEIDDNASFDKYGRLLGHVFNSNGESLQLSLLETGLARIAYLFDDYKYISEYKAAEKRALNSQINIHSVEGYVTDSGFDMNVVDKNILDMSINDIIDMIQEVPNKSLTDLLKFVF